MAGRHIAIETWLDALNMTEYVHLFRDYGGVEDLIFMGEAEVKDIGINNNGHRAKVVSSLRILREKFEKGQVTGSGLFSLQRVPSMSGSSGPNSPTSPDLDFLFVLGSPEKLQADLQKELAGDPSEIRSRSWYHGNISRQRAESLVTNNGDFLVRDCISKPGDFVLTCRWTDAPLNFMINSIIRGSAPGRLPTVSYQLEDEEFPSIKQLVAHYQHRKKPVSVASEAILKNPVPRCMPLSSYDSKYGAAYGFVASAFSTPLQSPISSPFVTPFESPWSSPEITRRKIERKDDQLEPSVRTSQTGNNCNNMETPKLYIPPPSLDKCDSLPIINVTPPSDQPVPMVLHEKDSPKRVIAHTRGGSAPAMMTEVFANGTGDPKFSTTDKEQLDPEFSENEPIDLPPPPKPSRVPSSKFRNTTEMIPVNMVIGDHRDYYNCIQEQITPFRFDGNTESLSKCEDKLPFSSLDQSYRDSTACHVYRDRVCTPAQQTVPETSNRSLASSGYLSMQQIRSLKLLPTPTSRGDAAQTPSPPTYQIVARSRSFHRSSRNSMDVNGNSFDHTDKGGRMPPNRTTRAKTIEREHFNSLLSDQGNNNNNNDNNDRLKADFADDSDIFGLHYIECIKAREITTPWKFCKSSIEPGTFKSSFLPKGYKILDQSVLTNVKTTLFNKIPGDVALQVTKYDLVLMSIAQEKDFGLGVTSGLEFLTLPQGKKLRQDIIERWECLRLFVIMTLLTSQAINERAQILSFWIQASLELKKSGNLYSFAAVASALTAEHISRLSDTWLVLRQTHTTSAYIFDTNLRPAFLLLNDATSDTVLKNTCVPYVTPICHLLEQDSALQQFYWEKDIDPIAASIDVLLAHLDKARVIASQSSLYLVMGKSLTTFMPSDPELRHILCPEFHLLVLWGEKGYKANRKERVEKLEHVFMTLSYKYEAAVENDDAEI